MTELYLDSGTYLKTFYSVMYSPSCVQVGEMGDNHVTKNNPDGNAHYRIHHKINWNNCAAKILREEWKRG